LGTNKQDILKKAQTYTAKGQVAKAISEWEKLISETPNDGNIYNTIGDLYLKQKDVGKASESYMKAADVFRDSLIH